MVRKAREEALEAVARTAKAVIRDMRIDDIGGFVMPGEHLLALTEALADLEAASRPRPAEVFERFKAAVDGGADCPDLFRLRNEIKHDLGTEHQEFLNQWLRQLGCRNSWSSRFAEE